MVYDPSANTETFSAAPRDASVMARVIVSENSVTDDSVGIAVSNLDDILHDNDVLETQVAGSMGEALWDAFVAVR